MVGGTLPLQAQVITATLEGRVLDSTGAALPNASVTAVSTATGLSRAVTTNDVGEYHISSLPAGEYSVSAEVKGFRREVKKVTLLIGQTATLDFNLAVGEVTQEVIVEAGPPLEPTRTEVSSVIIETQIDTLPVNGRQFIDFALLVPGVTIGETTSGSTDVIIEPVTKISFAGQNIHYNLVAVDGADNISTASGVQKTTPSQEAVQEFRVINTKYSVEAGRVVGGIVNIITKSGTNDWHGSAYYFFRHDALDATSILLSPDPSTCNTPGDLSSGGCDTLDRLLQHQFGATLGGPIKKDKAFVFANYEGQRRRESPFYNSVIINNLSRPGPNNDINDFKASFGLPPENVNRTRTFDYDNFLVRVDATPSERHYLFVRYFVNDAILLNVSPLNDGFDLPSAFKVNFFTDHSLVGVVTSTFSPALSNDLRLQFAHRFFDFPTVTTQPHLEVANTFAVGVNRGNPDFYREPRFEIIDHVTWTRGKHTVSFGGNFNWVRTTESFPLFYPFEATFGCLYTAQCAFSMEAGAPFVIFFQCNDAASNFTEPTILPNGTAIFRGGHIPDEIRDLAKGTLKHTYNGVFIQDKFRATPNLTLNFGVRYEWETWPSRALDSDLDNVDPRFGFAWNLGTARNLIIRGGIGLFHGIIPSPLLACQIPSCGGVLGEYPGREEAQDDLNATTRLFAFASAPGITNIAMLELLFNGRYPDAVPAAFCPTGFLSSCGFLGDAVIVRFVENHQAPYGIQMSLGFDFEPFKDTTFSASYLRVKGLQLGSFYNINQPPPSGQELVHDSNGNVGLKDTFFCLLGPPFCPPPTPGVLDGRFAVYFEATNRWRSVYDGLLLNLNKRPTGHFGLGLSYTWSKSIDDGPNPSFVIIPQHSGRLDLERAISSDHIAHRFVGNATIFGPKDVHPVVNDFEFGLIVTAQSARFFTKFAGFDANGDVFGVNDRVGIEPRNTFKGDGLYSLDVRVSRTINLTERFQLQALAEVFNLFNILNVRFFNTVYGAADFCNVPPPLHPSCGAGPFFLEGSPSPNYGTPRSVFNPRQIQFAVRFKF